MQSDIKVGGVYRSSSGNFATYTVVLGESYFFPFYYDVALLGGVFSSVPKEATLETHSLEKHFSKPENREISIHEKGLQTLENWVYLGQVCEPTEQGVKIWLIRYKLMGFSIKDYRRMAVYSCEDIREKLECVKRFRVGKIYVSEPLAYLRRKTVYGEDDIIYRYLGKQGKYYVWEFKYLGNRNWVRQNCEKQLENMVYYNPSVSGYQLER